MIDIENILKQLANKRPVFHSEADFQHALAWEIQTCYPKANIRIEKPYKFYNKNYYIDLVVETDDVISGIELKYKTQKPKPSDFILNENERFYLKNQRAKSWGRYDFIKDICRLEGFCNHSEVTKTNKKIICYAIFLTNDLSYNKERKSSPVDVAFGIHHGRYLSGELKWSDKASASIMFNRKNPLKLLLEYNLSWQEYSQIENQKFEYLLVKISNLN